MTESDLDIIEKFVRQNVGGQLAIDAIDRLRAELASARKALEECRTSHCGYAITKDEQYPKVLASFWKELQRIDHIARTALGQPK